MSERASDVLIQFLNGRATPWAFDDLISGSQSEKLGQYRLELARLRDEYPPADGRQYCNQNGLKRIREIAEELRRMGH